MAIRLDTKEILALFNQSRLNAEEGLQKDRMMQINQELQDRQFAEQKREHDLAATWHAEEVARQRENDQLNARRYADQLEREKAKDAVSERHIKEQERLAWAQIENQRLGLGLRYDKNGRPVTKVQEEAYQQSAANQLLSEAAQYAPDSFPVNHETGMFGYLTDRAQKRNTQLDEQTVKKHMDFLNFAESAMKDPKYSHINVPQLLGPLMQQSKAVLSGLMSNEAMDLRGDEDTFGGNWLGNYDGYASQDAYGRYNIQNPIHEALRRINANPYALGR